MIEVIAVLCLAPMRRSYLLDNKRWDLVGRERSSFGNITAKTRADDLWSISSQAFEYHPILLFPRGESKVRYLLNSTDAIHFYILKQEKRHSKIVRSWSLALKAIPSDEMPTPKLLLRMGTIEAFLAKRKLRPTFPMSDEILATIERKSGPAYYRFETNDIDDMASFGYISPDGSLKMSTKSWQVDGIPSTSKPYPITSDEKLRK